LSHGCIRLEDAQRLGRWLMGREPQISSRDPEQNVLLPGPVPIYLTNLTAQVSNGQLTLLDDIYGRATQVAALR
jgi:L,D-transpeptidase YcbB